jgi:biopolymer transport protein ExbD
VKNRSFLKKIKTVSIVTAMADTALQLIIFFMVSTTYDAPNLAEIHLPESETQTSESEHIYLSLTRQGRIYLGNEEISLDRLRDYLSYRQDQRNKVVSVFADKDLPYRDIAVVLTLLQEQDFLNVLFMTSPRKDTGPGE